MRVLVTGSSGFIGSAMLMHLIGRGIDAHGLDWKPPRWRSRGERDHHCDINDAAAVEALMTSLRPDRIVHLAARADLSTDSVVAYNANIDGVLNLARAARQVGTVTRILWTSTQLVSRVGRVPAHDTDFDPNTSYGESKVVGERIVRGLDGAGLEWAILRPTTVWGPGMSDHYLSLLRYLESRRYFHAGRKPTPKSFSYIENAVYQIRALLEAPAERIHRQTFYIADDAPIDMRSWCDALSGALGVKASPVIPESAARWLARVGDVLNATVAPGFKFNSFRLRNILTPYVFDTSNLQAVVGPQPHDLPAAIVSTARWYREIGKNGSGVRP